MHVLIIEDDKDVAAYITKGLSESGYVVDAAHTGTEGLSMAQSGQYDILIVDRMLPELDGLSVIEKLRKDGMSTPVLILSALGEVDDRVEGLAAGGDDYLVKPYAFSELLARVQALTRRRGGEIQDQMMLEVADLQLDHIRHKVTRQGIHIALTNKEFMLLHLLIKRQGEALSRSVIASQIWDMNFDSDTNVVDVAINRLRAKIDAPFEKKLIHTVRSVGYMFSEEP